MPGPAHLLELGKEINLTPDQRAEIEKLYRAMKSEAVALGHRLIELEKQLEAKFASASVSETKLRTLLDKIGKIRSKLRYTHLVTHVRTLPLLTAHQVTTYNRLRGYGSR